MSDMARSMLNHFIKLNGLTLLSSIINRYIYFENDNNTKHSGDQVLYVFEKEMGLSDINCTEIDLRPLWIDLDYDIFSSLFNLYQSIPGEKQKYECIETKIPMPKFKAYEIILEADKNAFQNLDNFKLNVCCNTVYSSSASTIQETPNYVGPISSVISSLDGKLVVAGFESGVIMIFEYDAIFNNDDKFEDSTQSKTSKEDDDTVPCTNDQTLQRHTESINDCESM